MRAILIGPAIEKQSLKWLKATLQEIGVSSEDFLVGVDAGLDLFRQLKILPDFAIGDWDSLGKSPGKVPYPYVTLDVDKDRSDLYFALQAALEMGADEVICFGVTGGRPDHHLAALFELAETSDDSAPVQVTALDPTARYHFLSKRQPEIRLGGMKRGQVVSIFALGGAAEGVTLKGFAFPLQKARLTPSSHGLSNRARASSCQIKLRSGRIVVMVLE
jgi:thiamine pyrophosphokinase